MRRRLESTERLRRGTYRGRVVSYNRAPVIAGMGRLRVMRGIIGWNVINHFHSWTVVRAVSKSTSPRPGDEIGDGFIWRGFM